MGACDLGFFCLNGSAAQLGEKPVTVVWPCFCHFVVIMVVIWLVVCLNGNAPSFVQRGEYGHHCVAMFLSHCRGFGCDLGCCLSTWERAEFC